MQVNTANPAHTSKGGNDECYTESYAVYPLLEFMEPFRNKIIWCPFDKEESEFVKVFRKEGFKVICSHIDNGQDFYTYEPEQWDVMISNPPFTNKRKIFERAMLFNKPFALIMKVDWLGDAAPIEVMGEEMQLLLFKDRMKFKGQGNTVNFKAVYYCRNFLPKQIITRDFTNRKQLRMAV